MTEKMYIRNMTKDYPKLLQKIEKYCQYCLRCLHRANIHPKPTDFALISFQRNNGTLAEALVYPLTAIKTNTIENPLFFYGFKADYDFTNLEKPIQITFTENYEELKK